MVLYMADYLVEAGCVAAVYVLAKWLEAKLVRKAPLEMRRTLKDALVVCLSAVVALWAAGQVGVGGGAVKATKAFVGKPEF